MKSLLLILVAAASAADLRQSYRQSIPSTPFKTGFRASANAPEAPAAPVPSFPDRTSGSFLSSPGFTAGSADFAATQHVAGGGDTLGVPLPAAPAPSFSAIPTDDSDEALPQSIDLRTLGTQGSYQGPNGRACPDGQILHVDGSCVEPIVERQIFVYQAPEVQFRTSAVPVLPKPKVNYNFVFIRTPHSVGSVKPLVVPPAQQKTLVYVLSQRPEDLQQEVIEVPTYPTQPEVFFVNYAPGENPELPGGIDLQQALRHSAQPGQVIDGVSGAGAAFHVSSSSSELSDSFEDQSAGPGFGVPLSEAAAGGHIDRPAVGVPQQTSPVGPPTGVPIPQPPSSVYIRPQ